MCLFGHRRFYRPQMGGTKWNKSGTSEGTCGPVGWGLFSVQKLPSVGYRRAQNGLKMPYCAYLAKGDSGGPFMPLLPPTPSPQGHFHEWPARTWNTMFNPVSPMFNPFKAAEKIYGQYGNLGPELVISGAHPILTNVQPIWSNWSHLWPMCQFRASKWPKYGLKGTILCSGGPTLDQNKKNVVRFLQLLT